MSYLDTRLVDNARAAAYDNARLAGKSQSEARMIGERAGRARSKELAELSSKQKKTGSKVRKSSTLKKTFPRVTEVGDPIAPAKSSKQAARAAISKRFSDKKMADLQKTIAKNQKKLMRFSDQKKGLGLNRLPEM